MKKLKSISLIETLISLSIVGLSIIALLPVMTVKKSSFDPTKGNSQWQCYGTKNAVAGVYACNDNSLTLQYVQQNNAGAPVLIGTNTHPNSAAGPNQYTPRLIVDGTGFGNRNIYPLYVQNKLNFAGQEVEVDNTSVHMMNNRSTDAVQDQCSGTGTPQSNLYVGGNGVIIENQTTTPRNINATNTRVNFCSSGGNTYYNGKQINNNDTVYAIKNNNTEYINVTVANNNNLIGIGADALNPFNNTSNNSIAIATNSSISDNSTYSNTLLIGNLDSTNATPAFNTGFVISRIGNAPFNIHSNISVGNNGAGTITAQAFIIASDRNLKDILGKYTKGLNEILQIKPVNFAYKSDEKQNPHVGVIAQDLQKVFPESVSVNRDTGYLSVNTDGVFYALLNSIKALNAKNAELEKKNTELENKIAQLRAIRDRLRAEKGGRDE